MDADRQEIVALLEMARRVCIKLDAYGILRAMQKHHLSRVEFEDMAGAWGRYERMLDRLNGGRNGAGKGWTQDPQGR